MRLPRLFINVLALTALALGFLQAGWASETKKLVIFYSSIGSGHLSAAKALRARVQQQSPETAVVLKDVRDFRGKVSASIGESLYWFVVKNFPDRFTAMYEATMRKGNEAVSVSDLSRKYNEQQMLDFIKSEKADVVLATHYGSAQALGNLHEAGELKDVPIGWLHTDYIEGYLPRISARIDRSFLPHDEVSKIWESRGVSPQRFETTGMPLNPNLFKPVDRESFMTSQGLDPSVRTITLASGAEGVGDFPLIVRKLADQGTDPIQIVAVCANNKKHVENLNKLKESLPPNVKLIVKGFVPQEELLSFVKSSDVYITKGGGLSPTEGFAINRPTVILDVYGGHESENARLFERLNLAVVNRDQNKIGEDVFRVLGDKSLQQKMMGAQLAFKNSLNVERIVDFALNPPDKNGVPRDFGAERGFSAQGTAKALAKLEYDSPADIEILLSNATAKDPNAILKDNPFGHIAIRIDDKVYTVLQNATPEKDSALMTPQSLEHYLYGTTPHSASASSGSNYGLGYARETLGLRVKDVPEAARKAMVAEIEKIEKEWAAGITCFDWAKKNCANFGERILKAGGFEIKSTGVLPYGMPLDLFDSAVDVFEKNPNYATELVAYRRLGGSANQYVIDRFPLSPHQPVRALKNLMTGGETRLAGITKTIGSEIGTPQVSYENLDRSSVGDLDAKIRADAAEFEKEWSTLKSKEENLYAAQRSLNERGFTPEQVEQRIRAVRASLSPSEIERIYDSKRGPPLSPEKETKIEELRKFLAESDSALKDFHAAYDDFNREKIEFFMRKSLIDARNATELLAQRLTSRQMTPIRKHLENAQKFYSTYLSKQHLYGQPKDVQRVDAARSYFKTLKFFAESVSSFIEKPAESSVLSATTKSGITGILKDIFAKAKIGGALIGVVKSAFLNAQSGPGETPIVDNINKFFKRTGQAIGLSIDVVGRENIPKTEKGVVNIFTIQHSNPILDQIVLSEIAPENYGLFAAADTFMPRFAADQMDRSDHFIVVGRGSDKPINKASDLLKRGKIQNLVIYPEGSVPAGLYDGRPLRDKFIWGLVDRVQKDGFKVNIVPISLPDNFRFNNNWQKPIELGADKVRAIIHPALDTETVDILRKTGDEQALNRHIRSIWFSNQTTGSNDLLGMPKLDLLEKRMNQFLSGSCDALYGDLLRR